MMNLTYFPHLFAPSGPNDMISDKSNDYDKVVYIISFFPQSHQVNISTRLFTSLSKLN